MNTDRRDLLNAIETAKADLEKLAKGIFPSSLISVRAQAESALCFADYAREIVRITADLRIVAVEKAAGLAETDFSATDRQIIRQEAYELDLISDAADKAERFVPEAA